jgi:hypothetical protein
MSTLTAVEVSAVVSAVVTTSFNTIVRYGERLSTFVRTRLPDDHTAIYSGSLRLGVQSQTDRVAVQVSSAPSRRLKRKGMEIDAAIAAVDSWFGSHFPVFPERSGPDIGVSFTVMMEDDALSVDRRLWLYPSGRIDLYWCIPVPSHEYPAPLEVMTLLWPLVMLVTFVRSADYYRIWARPRGRVRRHFDWRFVASMDIYGKDRQSRSWELQFPGPAPRRAADRMAFCPSSGYAAEELTGWPVARPMDSLVRVALRSVLFHNGYHDVEAAVDDVVARHQREVSDHDTAAGSATRSLPC